MAERNIKLEIEYDGAAYSGWQIQHGQRTIQGEITEAIKKTTGQEVNLIAAGRTDAGVHALGQIANFRIEHHLETERFTRALNYYLDDDILIKSSVEVPHEFHSRYDAQARRYRYLIGLSPTALYRGQRWFQPGLDLGVLNKAAALVAGMHDFSAFCVAKSQKENNACRIERSQWSKMGNLLIYDIRGNRFLHNMVRSLVGAMANVAADQRDDNRENLTLDEFADIIHAPNGRRNVFTAPAHGLYLMSVTY